MAQDDEDPLPVVGDKVFITLDWELGQVVDAPMPEVVTVVRLYNGELVAFSKEAVENWLRVAKPGEYREP